MENIKKITVVFIMVISVSINIYLMSIVIEYEEGFFIKGTYVAGGENSPEQESLSFQSDNESDKNSYYYSKSGEDFYEGKYEKISNNIYKLEKGNKNMGMIVLSKEKLTFIEESRTTEYDKVDEEVILIEN